MPDRATKAPGSYDLHFRNHPQSHRPVVEREQVRLNDEPILERPDERDRSDPERLTQTHLEQVSENQRAEIRYLHLVPQIVRRRNGDYRDDPYGSDLLEQIADTNRDQKCEITQDPGGRIAVPHFGSFELDRDLRGNWHLNATYDHWRAHSAKQSESAFPTAPSACWDSSGRLRRAAGRSCWRSPS